MTYTVTTKDLKRYSVTAESRRDAEEVAKEMGIQPAMICKDKDLSQYFKESNQ